jgi:hypothetical protein
MYVVVENTRINLKKRYRKLKSLLKKQWEVSFISQLNKLLSIADIYVFHSLGRFIVASLEYAEKPEHEILQIVLLSIDGKLDITVKYEKKTNNLHVELYTDKW